jgi:hypothetical protein
MPACYQVRAAAETGEPDPLIVPMMADPVLG